MQNKNIGIILGCVVILITIVVIFLWRFGIGRPILQESGAMIASTWQNLFSGATYDVNPDDDYISDDESASDTAISAATTTFDASDDNADDATGGNSPKIIAQAPPLATKPNNQSDFDESESGAGDLTDTLTTTSPTSPVSSSDVTQNIPQPACAFPSASPSPLRQIIFNEIAWMGSPSSTGESASAAANDEWIELKNISTGDIDLAGWSLMSGSGGIKIIFMEGDHIPAGGLWLLARGTGSAASLIAKKIYSGGLSNTGDELALFDAQCDVSDFLDASSGWPAGNNTTKQTLERAADHTSWQTSAPVGGTPGAENSSGVPVQQTTPTQQTGTSSSSSDSGGGQNATSTPSTTFCPANHVVIAQVQIVGASSANDFIKLYNPTAVAVDISGWKLRKKSSGGTDESLKVLGKGSIIGSLGYFTWANSSNGFAASIGADVSSTETLAADNSAALMDASGTIVDEVAWGTGTSQYVEGNAFPTDPTANQILERILENAAVSDSDDNATDFALH